MLRSRVSDVWMFIFFFIFLLSMLFFVKETILPSAIAFSSRVAAEFLRNELVSLAYLSYH